MCCSLFIPSLLESTKTFTPELVSQETGKWEPNLHIALSHAKEMCADQDRTQDGNPWFNGEFPQLK